MREARDEEREEEGERNYKLHGCSSLETGRQAGRQAGMEEYRE